MPTRLTRIEKLSRKLAQRPYIWRAEYRGQVFDCLANATLWRNLGDYAIAERHLRASRSYQQAAADDGHRLP